MAASLSSKPLQQFTEQHEQRCCFSGKKGMRIHTLHYANRSDVCIVIAPGRAEVAFKYRELAYDLWQQGYAVAVIDHRGQGLSQRFFADMQLGHMDDFEYAVDDLQYVATQLKQQYSSVCLIAHSMGGAISCRLMQRQPDLFSAAALSCPMLSLTVGPIAPSVAPHLLAPMVAWDKLGWVWAHRKPTFISRSRGESAIEPFEGNRITSSETRYAFIQQQIAANPDYALGGPTAQWAQQAFIMMNRIQQQIECITTPLLILQGGKDQVVSAQGQSQLAMALPRAKSQWIHIADGRHELLMERDELRDKALNHILQWFTAALTK